MKTIAQILLMVMAAVPMLGQETQEDPAQTITITGYVLDSGCVHRFHEVVKPLPNGCLQACVRSGSPLVILTKGEEVYHPISAEMPDVDVRNKLLPFAGKLVRITGKQYDRGGSKAIKVEQIEEIKDDK